MYIAEYRVKKAQAIQEGQPEPPAPRPLKPLSQEKIDKVRGGEGAGTHARAPVLDFQIVPYYKSTVMLFYH